MNCLEIILEKIDEHIYYDDYDLMKVLTKIAFALLLANYKDLLLATKILHAQLEQQLVELMELHAENTEEIYNIETELTEIEEIKSDAESKIEFLESTREIFLDLINDIISKLNNPLYRDFL